MTKHTFNFTGSEQTWTVPNHIDKIETKVYGAASTDVFDTPAGGYVNAIVEVTPGETVYVYVGEDPEYRTSPGGWPDGGTGGDQDDDGEAGGGSSDIRLGGNTLNDRVIVAGAGGGGGADAARGGAGGGLTADSGEGDSAGGGGGGSQNSGGSGGTGEGGTGADGEDGSFGQGGDAADGASTDEDGGGGGGGGWYGGGAGGSADDLSGGGGAGGGGSSYVGGALTVISNDKGVNYGDGEVIIWTVPNAPTNISASTVGDHSIDLSWTDPPNLSGDIEIYRSEDPSVDTSDSSNLVDTVSTGVESYTDSGIDDGTQYHYVLVSVEEGVSSDDSTEVSATTTLPAPDQLSVVEVIENSVVVGYNVNSNDEDNILTYKKVSGATSWLQDGTISPGTESYTYADLLYGRDYELYVSAKTVDVESDSSIISTTTDIASINNLSVDTSVSGQLDVSWDSPLNNGEYYIEVTKVSDGSTIDTATEPYHTRNHLFSNNIVDGVDYKIEIRPETVDVTGDFYSTTVSANLPKPRIDKIMYHRNNSVSIDINIQDNFQTGRVDVYRSDTQGNLGDKVGDVNISADNTVQFVDTSVESLEEYYYTVRRVS